MAEALRTGGSGLLEAACSSHPTSSKGCRCCVNPISTLNPKFTFPIRYTSYVVPVRACLSMTYTKPAGALRVKDLSLGF